jgi:adenylate kinase family enzyme
MNKIAVIGIMGAGKSTLSNILGKVLNIPVIHLDKETWLPGWQHKYTHEELVDFQQELVKKSVWIIDGNYQRTMDIRLNAADTIIYFDFPKFISLWRAIKRVFSREQPFDKKEGVKERISWNLIKIILKYPKKSMTEKLAAYSNKTIFIFKNQKDVDNFLSKIQSNNSK